MGVYIHKSILELDLSLTLTEKLVLAYFLANKNNLKDNNVVIANRLNLTKTNVRQIIFSLKHKKIIEVMGGYSERVIKILKPINFKFNKSEFNGFSIDDDILKLDLNTTKKFILAEIKSLINSKNGKCNASNLHIANLLGLKERAIRTALSELENGGFLTRDLKNVNGKTKRTIILNLNNNTDEEIAVKDEADEASAEQYNDEVLSIFESFPKRPMMTALKIEEQKKLCLPILKSKTKEELDFIKFVINYNVKNNKSWTAGFMPYMYRFLTTDKEKYFCEEIKNEFKIFKNKQTIKVNANLQLLTLRLEQDLFYFFAELEDNIWENFTNEELWEEFIKINKNTYLKFDKSVVKKEGLKRIKEYRPPKLF
ncbi:helix-turn-helix domain-containing protein [Megamonas sp.]|uniref:helix-turn-helix domain-containing protein n=1 Tax=Megamonas sp. TaxID=2049033 RepID=UPI00257E36CB|nr:helix-turn-helix domain-containing protein [Megamonas sp.]MBS5781165.1 helix-turn-helix domain-containing protein [Megamonas sp.]